VVESILRNLQLWPNEGSPTKTVSLAVPRIGDHEQPRVGQACASSQGVPSGERRSSGAADQDSQGVGQALWVAEQRALVEPGSVEK